MKPAGSPWESPGEGPEVASPTPLKVLCIEDEPDILKLLKIALRQRGNYQVVTAPNGLVGLEMAEKECPDLILLDAMMPVMDGYETCKRLKENPATRHIPVIFLAAKTQQKEIKKGLDLGAVDYLTKPFDPMTLPDQIRDILNNSGGDGAAGKG